jgi:iron complex transport system ATP-binding protein
MIQTNALTFSYDGDPVLSDISLSISNGQRWAIIGKNGAGKSTLIRLIAGLEKSNSGSIKIKGRELAGFHPRDLARIIAYVPQARDRILPYPVLDYVMMGRFPYQGFMAMPSRDDREIVLNALELTDCTEFSNRLMNQLSGGEIQRVLLAGAVSQRTEVMLLDEPATFLDPLHQAMVHKALDRIHQEFGTTMITVTHDINSAIAQNDMILALVKGKAFFSGPIKDFLARSPGILEAIFGIRFDDGTLPGTSRRIVVPRNV